MTETKHFERPAVHGVALDEQTRCAHYHSRVDVIAIRMKCCNEYYACNSCHAELADHPLQRWPADERNEHAVLCGVCGTELTIADYMASGDRCCRCGADFNPGCRSHHHFYFSTS